MPISPQLNPPERFGLAKASKHFFAPVSLVVVVLWAGCSARDSDQLQAPNIVPRAITQPHKDIDRHTNTTTAHQTKHSDTPSPEAVWTYAPGMEAFHQIWHDRFGISAQPIPDQNTLLPYADALMFQGSSWGMDPASIELLVMRPNGKLYRFAGAEHPGPEHVSKAEPQDAGAPMDWPVVKHLDASAEVQYRFTGTKLQLAGPLVATESCLGCHDYQPGVAVGLYSYTFSEIADD